MQEEELKKYQNKLTELKKKLEKEIKETPDIIDYGTEAGEDEEVDEAISADVQASLKKNFKRRLEDVKSALIKIKEKTYGLCEKCKGEIEKEILKIDPESRHCKKHKSI